MKSKQYQQLQTTGIICIAVFVLFHVVISQFLESVLYDNLFDLWMTFYMLVTAILTAIFMTAIILLVLATRTMDKIEKAAG